MPALGSAACKYFSSVRCVHPLAETVFLASVSFLRLECSKHGCPSFFHMIAVGRIANQQDFIVQCLIKNVLKGIFIHRHSMPSEYQYIITIKACQAFFDGKGLICIMRVN